MIVGLGLLSKIFPLLSSGSPFPESGDFIFLKNPHLNSNVGFLSFIGGFLSIFLKNFS